MSVGRRPRVPLSLLILLSLVVRDGCHATIDNVAGAVRENSLPPEQQQHAGSEPAPTVIANTISESTIDRVIDADTHRTEPVPSSVATESITEVATTASISRPSSPSEVSSIEPTHQPQQPSADIEFPPNCSEFPPSKIQLVYSEKARIRKCCPPGQMIQPRNEFDFECVPGKRKLQIETVVAQFYGNNECIEVTGEPVDLPVESNDILCEDHLHALIYSADQEDELFVLQNGSLLVLEFGTLVSVFDSYCVEMTNDTQLLAKVCGSVRSDHLAATKALIISGVSLTVVVLLFTALCYSFVPKLKDHFGYLIATHAGTCAIGTIFLGLATCGDRCIDPASIAIAEVFGNALLGSSVFVFVLMNVFNTLYLAYYIPNGLEYDNRNKREMYAFLTVLYCITLVPLFLFPKGGLVSIVFLYFVVIVITQGLGHYYARRLTSGNYLHITDTPDQQIRINQTRLKEIRTQSCLCLKETLLTLTAWIAFTVVMMTFIMNDAVRIGAVYCLVVQGLSIGVVFISGQRWTIVRECWSNSGSVDLSKVENAIEMKTIKRATVPRSGKEDLDSLNGSTPKGHTGGSPKDAIY